MKALVVAEIFVLTVGIIAITPVLLYDISDDNESRLLSIAPVPVDPVGSIEVNSIGDVIVLTSNQLIKVSENSIVWNIALDGRNSNSRLFVDAEDNILVISEIIDLPSNDTGIDMDILLSKYSTSGKLIWQKHFGGRGEDHLWDITFDSDNNIYAVGITWSPDFPIINGTYPQHSLNQTDGYYVIPDGIVLELSREGELIWSTYFSGSEYDDISQIEIIGSEIFVFGSSSSSEIPKVNGDYSEEFNFLASFTKNGEHRRTDILKTVSGDLLTVEKVFWNRGQLIGVDKLFLYNIQLNGTASELSSIYTRDRSDMTVLGITEQYVFLATSAFFTGLDFYFSFVEVLDISSSIPKTVSRFGFNSTSPVYIPSIAIDGDRILVLGTSRSLVNTPIGTTEKVGYFLARLGL